MPSWGPNGSGKSTLSYVLPGREGYEVTEGSVTYKGEDLLAMEPDERAAKGVFLAFQYPIEIPGVATMQFLKVALNAQRKARGEKELSTPDFMRLVKARAAEARHLAGHAEARRQCRLLRRREEARRDPADGRARADLCILDETDSGLDIDALRDRRRWRQCAALARSRHDRHHPLSAPCSTTSCRTWCMSCRRAGS